jgi:hypothetical protein
MVHYVPIVALAITILAGCATEPVAEVDASSSFEDGMQALGSKDYRTC